MLLVCCYSVISMFLYNIYFVYVLYIYIFIYKKLLSASCTVHVHRYANNIRRRYNRLSKTRTMLHQNAIYTGAEIIIQ